MSDVTGFSGEGDQEGFSDANPFQIRKTEYGVAENDVQNRFALSLNYELQYGKSFTGIKKQVFAGWGFNTISAWQSGKPFSILDGGGNDDTTTFVDPNTGATVQENFGNCAVPNNGGGRDRPDQTGSVRAGGSPHNFFNTSAFVPQLTGTVGDVERNSLFGPHFRHVDIALTKKFSVTERTDVQFTGQAFNLSNTPSYIIPLGSGNAQLGNPAFGTVTNYDPNYNPRQYQFALKFQF